MLSGVVGSIACVVGGMSSSSESMPSKKDATENLVESGGTEADPFSESARESSVSFDARSCKNERIRNQQHHSRM